MTAWLVGWLVERGYLCSMINGTLPFMKLVQNGPRYEIVLVPHSIPLWVT